MEINAIRRTRAIIDDTIYDNTSVIIEKGVIKEVLPGTDTGYGYDAKNAYLSSGFIDLHFHGVKGIGTDSLANINEICTILPRYGVTGFLPTIIPAGDEEEDVSLIHALSDIRKDRTRALGLLLEGHYLAQKGALNKTGKSTKEPERLNRILDAGAENMLVFCISPEYPEIEKLLPQMTKYVPAFVTHTKADLMQARRSISLGATHATHFLNVFLYPGDIEPGVRGCGAVEAFLSSHDTTVDFILDGEHVQPEAVLMVIEGMGTDRVSFITDSNVNAGMPPGNYRGLGGNEVTVAYEGGPARMSAGSRLPGGLSGSGLTGDRLIKNAVSLLGLSLPDAVKMTSLSPAAVLGFDGHKGRVRKGYDADLVLFDSDIDIQACFVAGRCCYDKKKNSEERNEKI